jgi:16S rRNA (cytosine967-C5)-methyltransferase
VSRRPIRADLVDAAVLEVYGLVRDQGWLADRALERVMRREQRLYAAERRAASEALYGLVRWQGQMERVLGGRPDLATLYAGWLARHGGLTAEAAVRRLGLPSQALAGLAGADDRLATIRDPVDRLSAQESLPYWIARRFVAELGDAQALALAQAMNRRAPLTVRVNLLHTDRDRLRERLAEEGTTAEPTRLSPWGLTLDGHANAFTLESFQKGLFEIQDEGSQLVALACGARPGEKVVDACAGAGGKSLALAMEMHNRGELFALDVDQDRLDEARRRARRAGVHNLRTRLIPAGPEAEPQLSDLQGQADRVLIDAPCSGLGTLRRKPDARWRLEEGDPERFAAMQRELTTRFARLVRPGGRLIYATCAVGSTENGEVADFIERELTHFAPVPIERALGAELTTALGAAGCRLQLYPHRHGTDGFFLAVFERRE